MLPSLSTYPHASQERDEWIVARRGPRNAVDPYQPYAFFVEDERTADGEIAPVATVFLTNRECPWRCLECDLWRDTLTETVPAGAIPHQIEYALSRLPAAKQIKLYNSGSFFDPRAVPTGDHEAIAQCVGGFDRVIVESHPALVGDACLQFRDRIGGRLEVAMGLETAHAELLARLNKHMTLEMFAESARFLQENEIDLRAFILVKPPFMQEAEAVEWARRSVEFAFECGATAATLISTRGGNGALDELTVAGDFSPPLLQTLERAFAESLLLNQGRVFLDLWDAGKWRGCAICRESRIARLRAMNLEQKIADPLVCDICEESE